jgi:hypothetical protein
MSARIASSSLPFFLFALDTASPHFPAMAFLVALTLIFACFTSCKYRSMQVERRAATCGLQNPLRTEWFYSVFGCFGIFWRRVRP